MKEVKVNNVTTKPVKKAKEPLQPSPDSYKLNLGQDKVKNVVKKAITQNKKSE